MMGETGPMGLHSKGRKTDMKTAAKRERKTLRIVELALRILIGEGAGQNWWCVVFPPLCTAASADVPETALAAGLTEDQVSLMTEEDGGYQLKFKAVELWERLKAALE